MRSFSSSWSSTLRKLGFRSSHKRQRMARRNLVLERLEERINFSSGMDFVYQTPVATGPCKNGCSPVKLSSSNAATTTAGRTAYNSSSDPVVNLQFHFFDSPGEVIEADYIRADATIGIEDTVSFFWAGGGDGIEYETEPEANGEFDALLTVRIDASGLQTGVYEWNVASNIYLRSDPNTGLEDIGDYTEDDLSTEYFVHVVNRIDGPFGDGWSLSGLDQLIVQNSLPGQPDGVALLTSDDALIWFDNPSSVGGGEYEYAREDNPYCFSELRKLSDGTYRLTEPDGTVKNFLSNGLLHNVVDRYDDELYLYDYDLSDRVSLIKDVNGRYTKFQYNGHGKIESITDFCESDGDSTSASQVTEYAYTYWTGNKVSQMKMLEPDPDGPSNPLVQPVSTYNFNTAGQLVSMIDARGLETTVSYDVAGLVSEIVERCGGTIEVQTVDSQGVGAGSDTGFGTLPQLTPFRFRESILYDDTGTEGFETQIIYGSPTQILRGERGNVLAATNVEGTTKEYFYYDDGLLNLTIEPDPTGTSAFGALYTSYSYDRGRITEIVRPDNTSEQWEYDDESGQIESYTDANLNETTYFVDAGYTLSKTRNDGTTDLITEYSYTDESGATSIGSLATTTRLGFLETKTDANNITTLYTYYANGLVKDIVYGEGTADETTVHYEYDDRDRLHKFTDGRGGVTEYVYDNLDRLIRRIDPDPDGTGFGHPLASPVWQYFYDPSGNLTHVIDPMENDTEYVYDVRGRVWQTIQPVDDPEATPAVTTKDTATGMVTVGSWHAITRTGSLNGGEYESTTDGASAVYTFTSLDADKKYAVQVRWTPSGTPTDYDTNALFEVFGDTGADPLNSLRANLDSEPQGQPDGSDFMWLSLGAFSAYSNTLTLKLNDDDSNGKLVIDAVRLVEVGPVTQTDYDCNGNLISTIDPLNHITKYEYDDLNQLISRTDPDPDGDLGEEYESPVTEYAYNSAGWLTSVTDAGENLTVYRYDLLGRQTNEIKVGVDGLTGEYFDDNGKLLHTRIDPTVDFAAAADFAGFEDLPNDFSAVWTGAISFPSFQSDLTLYLDSTDSCDLYLDGKRLVHHSGTGSMSESHFTIPYQDGVHSLMITFKDDDHSPNSGLVVSYDTGDGKTPIPWDLNIVNTALVTTTNYNDAGYITQVLDGRLHGLEYTYDDVNRFTRSANVFLQGDSYIETGPATNYTYNGLGQVTSTVNAEDNLTLYMHDGIGRQTKELTLADLAGLRGEYRNGDGELLPERIDEELNFALNEDFAGFDLSAGFSATWAGAINIDTPSSVTFYLDSTDKSALYIDDQLVVENSSTSGMQESFGVIALAAGWHTIKTIFNDQSDMSESGLIVSYDIGGKDVIPSGVLDAGVGTTTTYDDASNPATVTDANGNTTTFEYDNLNRLITESIEIDVATLTRSYQYDDNSRLTYKTDRNERVAKYEYDNLNRLKFEDWYDDEEDVDSNRTISYAYDAASNLTQVSDPSATYNYYYDDMNRELEVSQTIPGLASPILFHRTYDANSRMTSVAAKIDDTDDYVNSYSYDIFGQLSMLTQADQDGGNAVTDKRVDFSYSPVGQLTKLERYASSTKASPVATSDYGYDVNGRVTAVSHLATAIGSSLSETHGYSYDSANRVTHYSSLRSDFDTSYTYDSKGQITAVDYTGLPTTNESYGYDDNGNRTDVSNVNTDAYTSTTGDGNRLLANLGYEYDYDDEGNLIRRTTSGGAYTVYEWDHRNRLVAVVERDDGDYMTSWVTYTYDAFNQLIGRQQDFSGETFVDPLSQSLMMDSIPQNAVDIYVHDLGQVVLDFRAESWEGGTPELEESDLAHRYLWGPAVDQLLADENVVDLLDAGDNDTLWALTDKQGSVTDMVDSNGTERLHRVFDSFGIILEETNYDAGGIETALGWPELYGLSFAYTGRALDRTTRLQNNLNRWYDSATGRWLSEDPIGFDAGDANLYRYVANSPTNYTDPSGREFILPPEMRPRPPAPSGPKPGSFSYNYCYYIIPGSGHSAPVDPWYYNWGSEIFGGVAIGAGGLAAVGPEVTITGAGTGRCLLRVLKVGIRRDPAHHGKPHGHWHIWWL